jgi:O-antigen/teichoic acid export membrane protein
MLATLGRDSLVYGAGTVVTRSSALLLLPLYSAYFSPEEFGTLAMIALLTMVVHPVFALGLGAAMGPYYFNAGDRLSKDSVIWTAAALLCASAAILIAGGWLLAPWLCELVRIHPVHSDLVRLALGGCALNVIATVPLQRVQFDGRAWAFLRITTAAALTSILCGALFVAALGWGMTGYLAAQLCTAAVPLVASTRLALAHTHVTFVPAIAYRLLALGLPLVPSFAFLFILTHGNKYLLEWHAGLDAVGIYTVGFTLGAAISVVTSGMATAWYPFFMRYLKRQDEARVVFGRIFSYYWLLGGLLCAMFFIFAGPLVGLLTPTKYHAASSVVGPVALAHFFQGVFSLLLPGLYFRGEVRMVSVVQALAAVALVLFGLPLVEQYGVVGAAWALAAGNFLMAALLFFWNCYRRTSYPLIAYEWRRVGLFAAAFAGLVAALEFILPSSPGPSLSIALAAGLCAAVLALLDRAERNFILSLLKVRAST